MAVVWRLARPEYGADLAGKGNRDSGSRWNSPGRGVVYASFNLSLCVLEAFIHLPPPLRIDLPEMVAIKMELPSEATQAGVALTDLPRDLNGEEAHRRCREIGDQWLRVETHLLLTAPSFVVPQELNVMINPVHAHMRDVKIVSTEPFRFDPRLSTRR